MNLEKEIFLFEQGYQYIGGVDEVGRGACAGPIVAGVVVFDKKILKSENLVEQINDSKKLRPDKREELEKIIREQAVCWAVGIVEAEVIDTINIGYANRLCISNAFEKLAVKPQYIVCDFVHKMRFITPFELIPKGDATIVSIAAASIVAKVYRDNLMKEYAQTYPEYGFEEHKGYCTKDHYGHIDKYGLCPLHRRSFGVAQKRLF